MRLCAIGDNVVDRYLDRDVMYPGGNAVNVAVYARRCGASSAYVGVVGDDEAGELVRSALRSEGIDISHTRVASGPNAYATVRLVDGDRVFGAASVGVSRFRLTPADLDFASSFDIVHTGDCSMLEEQVADLARHARVSFDFSVQSRAYAEPILPHVDIATFSGSDLDEGEVRQLIGWAHAHGARTVVVTRGAEGAMLSDGGGVHRQRPLPGPVVDTLGAGDGFIAGFLVSYVSGNDVRQAAEDAARHAASVCASFGAFGYEARDLGADSALGV